MPSTFSGLQATFAVCAYENRASMRLAAVISFIPYNLCVATSRILFAVLSNGKVLIGRCEVDSGRARRRVAPADTSRSHSPTT